jgi:hypothetical protein
MGWWSIRAVYLHDQEDGEQLYYERVMLFRADTDEAAFELAQEESKRHLELNPGFRRIGEWVGFTVNKADDLSGVEIWGEMSRSDLAPTDYYKARYGRFQLPPDEENDGLA